MKNILKILLVIVIISLAWGVFNTWRSRPEPKPLPNVVADFTAPKQEGLPMAVEAKREAIYKAALSRNYEALAKEASEPFSYSFGGPVEGGFEAYLERAQTQKVFELIPKLLEMPYGKQGDIYAWPYVHFKPVAEWTEEDVNEMRKILTNEEIEQYKKFGAYYYYRLGIKEDGQWIYYIAGD